MIIKAAMWPVSKPKFIQNWRVCRFLVKHPSHQTEQAKTVVFLVLIYDLERGRINNAKEDGNYDGET